jgi:putative aldouronate transport system substrate-binding protein
MRVRQICIAALLIMPAILFAAGQDEATAASEGPVELSWLGINAEASEDAIGFQEFNRALNVKIMPEPVSFVNREQMNLLLAGGDLPDHMLLLPWAFDQFWDEGALEPISVDEVKEHMPTYIKLLAETHGPNWNKLWYMADENTFRALPHAVPEGGQIAVIRTDWLQQVGLDMPSSAAELEEVFKAFTTQDPDGNGKDDSFGISVSQGRVQDLYHLYMSFGFDNENMYMLEGGKMTRAAISPNFKDALKWIQGMYEKGYIFPDVTLDRVGARDLFVNNKVGAVADTFTFLIPAYRPAEWYALFFNNNPGATTDWLPPVPADGYKVGAAAFGSKGWAYSGMKTGIEDIKKQKIMELLELQLADMYYHRVIWGGVPDVHHTLREDGRIELVDEWKPAEKQLELGLKFLLINMRVTPETLALSYGTDRAIILDHIKKNYNKTAPLPRDGFQSLVWNEVGADVSRIQEEFIWKAVTGQVDVDAEWDDYVATWLRAGGRQLLDEAQAAYDAVN